jgi:hypothetical protein
VNDLIKEDGKVIGIRAGDEEIGADWWWLRMAFSPSCRKPTSPPFKPNTLRWGLKK